MALEFKVMATDAGDYTLEADGITITASRVRWVGSDLHGEVFGDVSGGAVPPTAITFNRASSREEVQRVSCDAGWSAAVSTLCSEVIAAERTTRAGPVRLCEVPKPVGAREFAVAPLPSVPRDSMAIWFGDGGTGKSLLALLAGGRLALQGIPVLFLDFEWSADEHRLRYERLFGTDMPADLHHWACDRPLPQCAAEIR